MLEAAAALEFEKAAKLRDELKRVRAMPDGPVLPARPKRGERETAPPGSPGTRARRGKGKRKPS